MTDPNCAKLREALTKFLDGDLTTRFAREALEATPCAGQEISLANEPSHDSIDGDSVVGKSHGPGLEAQPGSKQSTETEQPAENVAARAPKYTYDADGYRILDPKVDVKLPSDEWKDKSERWITVGGNYEISGPFVPGFTYRRHRSNEPQEQGKTAQEWQIVDYGDSEGMVLQQGVIQLAVLDCKLDYRKASKLRDIHNNDLADARRKTAQEWREEILKPSFCGVAGHFAFQQNGNSCLMCQREAQLVTAAEQERDQWKARAEQAQHEYQALMDFKGFPQWISYSERAPTEEDGVQLKDGSRPEVWCKYTNGAIETISYNLRRTDCLWSRILLPPDPAPVKEISCPRCGGKQVHLGKGADSYTRECLECGHVARYEYPAPVKDEASQDEASMSEIEIADRAAGECSAHAYEVYRISGNDTAPKFREIIRAAVAAARQTEPKNERWLTEKETE